MSTKSTLAAALVASSLTPAFAQEAANDDYRAVLTTGYYEGGFRTTIIEGFQDLDSCLLQAKIATGAYSNRAGVSCDQGGKVKAALSCISDNLKGEAKCYRIDLGLPRP